MVKIEELIGSVLKEIKGKPGNDELTLVTDKDDEYRLYHEPDCCESVYLDDIAGELSDLIGAPILEAEEVVSGENPPEVKTSDYYQDSFTWTFYKFRTIKGRVTLRWYGSSNRYYSESVDISKNGKSYWD